MIAIFINPGELLDKISILSIKKEKINDPKKLECINNEYNILNLEFQKLLKEDEGVKLMQEYLDLKDVNKKLWKVEDDIRLKEKKSEFDSEFIGLARSVYQLNDYRFQIKNRINTLLHSEIGEQKSY